MLDYFFEDRFSFLDGFGACIIAVYTTSGELITGLISGSIIIAISSIIKVIRYGSK